MQLTIKFPDGVIVAQHDLPNVDVTMISFNNGGRGAKRRTKENRMVITINRIPEEEES